MFGHIQSIQFFLSAIVADRSIRILRARNKSKFKITKLARPLFMVASLCNLLVGFIWCVTRKNSETTPSFDS